MEHPHLFSGVWSFRAKFVWVQASDSRVSPKIQKMYASSPRGLIKQHREMCPPRKSVARKFALSPIK
ncbi:uncharacterized protein PHALS_08356 [Plasmopara halstedii]|uniref:Uncharacterized protein n=1 Tax=Plasmopara halstedii TaxID=4781 RepID=A0A0P1AD43_PLAHL|nr:uncharacterized protein PHALS_08356 [Plasmopara halstedii]CEG38273.1 hypothetical protein PHALS_08356 [Plasmopara halstedii]|eukprot:XP_024574642.1 hypothetical protein PHALS_08356 [Plasmopara halstedii]